MELIVVSEGVALSISNKLQLFLVEVTTIVVVVVYSSLCVSSALYVCRISTCLSVTAWRSVYLVPKYIRKNLICRHLIHRITFFGEYLNMANFRENSA